MLFIYHVNTNCWTVFFGAIVGVVAGPSIMQQRQLQLITGNANPNVASEFVCINPINPSGTLTSRSLKGALCA